MSGLELSLGGKVDSFASLKGLLLRSALVRLDCGLVHGASVGAGIDVRRENVDRLLRTLSVSGQ